MGMRLPHAGLVLALPLWLLAASAPAQQPAAPLLGDHSDGSRARPVHRVPLRDGDGEIVRPTDIPILPFSTLQTCGADCHDVGTIGRGWHFRSGQGGSKGRRPAEPWILVDVETATQLPLSYEGWPGTFHPDQVGITPWRFAKLFGGRTPGGLSGEREPGAQLRTRWAVSGDLEADCLACHDASPAYDHAEYGRQIGLENFRWAAAAASGMAAVTGSAKEMPNSFDHLLPFVEDALRERMPSVAYSPERFLPGARVVFDIVREVPARRCYFCHSNADVEHTGQGRWNTDADVHLARGMTCVDCHRNGLDHSMTRGYPGDPAASAAATEAVTCRGCHLASEPDRIFARGRLGAPYPEHKGLPPIHFEKLSCTACHSGPRPAGATRQLKTSQAHRLGGLNVNKASQALPHLYYPVFSRDAGGATTPNRLLWPAFWGRVSKGVVRPVDPNRVKLLMAKARVSLKLSPEGDWPALGAEMVARILALLRDEPKAEGAPVYVAGGRLHRLDAAGALVGEEHVAAQPYLWPIAHDVRPAALALGAKGCQDCHDEGTPLFFGLVAVDTPLQAASHASWPMARFQKGLDTVYMADFGRSFRYRPWLKLGASAAAGLLLLFVLAYAGPALGRLSAATGRERRTRFVVNLLGIAAAAGSVASAWPALLSRGSLSGYRLMVHVAASAALAGCAVLVALYWAHRNRFDGADWHRARRPFGLARPRGGNPYTVLLRKVSFWVALAAVIPAVASVTLAMFPLLPSVRQTALLTIHRYSAIALAISALLFACLALVAWIRGHEKPREAKATVAVSRET